MSEKNMTCPRCGGTNLKWAPHHVVGCSDCGWEGSQGNMFTPVPAIPVSEIRAYLQRKLDEWNALGDRRWEPANMWGYNFIMACFDDLARLVEILGAEEEST